METYKYFTWKTGKYFNGQDLLSSNQISMMLKHSVNMNKSEVFTTIQDYDADGNIIRCPLYFDIDSDSLFDAYNTMREICKEILNDYDLYPYVWFSGSKGFHIILPFMINGNRCHEVAKSIALSYSKDIDIKVYRTRSMLRVHGSINKKSGMYKVNVLADQCLDEILENAKNCVQSDINYKISESTMFDVICDNILKLLPDIKYSASVSFNNNFNDMLPCIKKLWNMDIPPVGDRHQLCHVIARFCFSCLMTIDETISLFKSHNFWKTVDENDYKKVITSVFRSGKSSIGCRYGSDADLLNPYCYDLCYLKKGIKDIVWPR